MRWLVRLIYTDRKREEKGFTLIETLVAVALIAITMLALGQSVATADRSMKRGYRNSTALELAVQKLEQLGAVDPSTLSAASGGTETLTSNGISFTRVTTVTVNADNSRSVTVQVTGTLGKGGNATLSNTFSEWGNV